MSLFWKNLGSDLGCKLTSACSLQSVDMETLLNSCTARVTCMDHLGLSKQTVLWLRACSMWAVLAGLSSWGRNHEPVAHMSGEQVNLKSSNAEIVVFFKKKILHKYLRKKKSEGVITKSFCSTLRWTDCSNRTTATSYASAHCKDSISFVLVLKWSNLFICICFPLKNNNSLCCQIQVYSISPGAVLTSRVAEFRTSCRAGTGA